MVDEERVTRLLDRVMQDIRSLRGFRDTDSATRGGSDLRDDPTQLAAAKYYFITGIEGCARVAHHIAAAEEWPAAESNADAIRRLAAEGVLDESVARTVASAVGFCNILVHEYTEVDDSYVLVNLDRIGDIEAFVAQVAGWMTGDVT